MSVSEPSRPHPYGGFSGSLQWMVIDRALLELADNRDLVETTAHEYIVGYLCEALANGSGAHESLKHSHLAALRRIQEMVKRANSDSRDLVKELIEERRIEAQIG